ncbi:MAG: AI-2E family transporter [Alcanivoracaceae bacterium]|nr:AI-2E family transporter [Alcanivoracaceae bacterium]
MKPWLTRMAVGASILAVTGYLLTPLWIAALLCILFYLLLEPIVASLQAVGVRKDLAIATALLPPLIALTYFAAHLADVGREYLPQLGADIEQLQLGITRTVASFDIHLESVLGVQLQLANQVAALDLRGWIQPERLLASTSWLANVLLNLVLVPPLAWFFLRDYRSWRDQALSTLPNHQFELGWLMYHRVCNRLQAYLRGLVLQALILASITSVGFWLIGMPSPLLLGALTGIAGLVPYLGPLLAMIAPVMVMIAGPGLDPGALMEIILVLAVGFGFDNAVVIPFLLAGSVNLHPAVAMVAVVVAGHVGGITGMVLVIPLLGMLRIIVETTYRGLQSP